MRQWLSVAYVALAFVLVTWVRRTYRAHVTQWMASRAGTTAASGRMRGVLWYGSLTALALLVLAGGFIAAQASATINWLRFPAALAVIAGYVPLATMGAPRLTKWQKSYGRRLVEAGAAHDAAFALAGVARVVSAIGLLAAAAAVLLAAYRA